jgi:tol-pal system protein YbgF
MKKLLFLVIISLLLVSACVSNKTFKAQQRKVQELEALQGHMQGELEMLGRDIVLARERLDNADAELLKLPAMQTQLDDYSAEIQNLQDSLTEQLDILETDLEDNLDTFTDHLRELKDASASYATKDELAEVIEESTRISQMLAELTGEMQTMSAGLTEQDSLLSAEAMAEQESKKTVFSQILDRVGSLESELDAIREENRLRSQELGGNNAALRSDLESLRMRVENVNGELSTLTSDLQDIIQKERTAAQKKREAAMNGQYQAALAQYYKGNHEQSILLFEDFLKTYSNVSLSANAHYWIGENYYSAGNFTKALREFQNVVSLFPEHDKAPDAQLKIGLSYYNLKDYNAAGQELNLIKTQYTGYAHMNLVDKYLRLSSQ